MIPEILQDLVYSKHSIRERLWEERGMIEAVPKHFLRSGCKQCALTKKGRFKAKYIYDDTRDLVLIIAIETKTVVTNYLEYADNHNQFKGRFRIIFKAKGTKVVAHF